ncbi:MAG: T9SS type A sorting domain-containing protein [Bacteroidia bacterium]|nr:T9SS type A sorting domain-containing protein [Bacteroidia bacterium]
MKKNILLTTAFILICISSFSQQWDWVKTPGQINYTNYSGWTGQKIVSDAAGNSFFLGVLEDTLSLGNFHMAVSPDSTTFLAKLNQNGNCLWCKKIKGLNISDLKIDSASRILVAGCYGQNCNENYIALFDSSGNELWNKSITGTSYRSVNWMDFDNEGNIYIKGTFREVLQIGNFSLSDSVNRTYIAKCTSNGNFLWLKKFPFEYKGGHNNTIWENTIFIMHEDSLTKLDSSGNFLSSSRFIYRQGFSPEAEFLLEHDTAGNLYIAQNFQSTVILFVNHQFTDLPGAPPPANYAGDIFVLKISQSQTFLWAKHLYSGGYDYISDMQVSSDGNVNLLGHTNAFFLYLDPSYLNMNYNSKFVIVFKGDGSLNETAVFSTCYATDFSCSPKDIFVTGVACGGSFPLVFGDITIQNYSGLFISKLHKKKILTFYGFQPQTSGNVNIFPNPGSGQFIIDFAPKMQNGKICLYDVFGNFILSQNISNQQSILIDLSKQAKGIYFVEVILGDERSTKKIILE